MAEKEFRVNEHIVLKLEEDKTNIYIADKLFRQCKSLFFVNPQENEHQSEINSIDEAMELLSTSSDIEIPPAEEFWGHCSNIQTWVENDYNTQILDMRLAFPILNELSDLGDKKARFKFSEEIFRRYDEGGENIKDYLVSEGYLKKTIDNPLYHLLCAEEADLILELQMKYNVKFKVDTTTYARNREEWVAVIKDRCISTLSLNYDEIKSCPDLNKLKNLKYAGLYVEDAEIIDIGCLPKSILQVTIKLESKGDSLIINNLSKLKNLRGLSVRNINKTKKIHLTIDELEFNNELESIAFSYFHINTLGDNKLKNCLNKLEYFTITNSTIKEIPIGIWKNENIVTINLDGTKIKTPVQDITKMKSLKYICLGSLKLPPANHLQDFRKTTIRGENAYIKKDFSIMNVPI